jgi:hypothetical protein
MFALKCHLITRYWRECQYLNRPSKIILTLQSTVFTPVYHPLYHSVTLNFAHCICVLHMIITINSDYFLKQH